MKTIPTDNYIAKDPTVQQISHKKLGITNLIQDIKSRNENSIEKYPNDPERIDTILLRVLEDITKNI